MSKIDLNGLGWKAQFQLESELYPDLYPGRVLSQFKDLYRVVSDRGELTAEVSGKLRYEVRTLSDYPAVGDFVMLDRSVDAHGYGIIHHVLTRKSAFIRKAAGTTHNEQIVASNIDTVYICMSLNNDFSLRRAERYLAIAWDSGALPVIVLTKADLCEDIPAALHEIGVVAIGVDVIVSSSMTDDGYSAVKRYLKPGQTVAFLGSSGVGKSTLINRLLGENALPTQELSFDDRGRHTTSRRELIVLSNGAMVIDTPGMREIGLESADLARAFWDIEALAAQCKFQDCSHSGEPRCAVQQAIAEDQLLEERLESYLKLKKEAKYEGLNFKEIENAKTKEMFAGVGGLKNARKLIKEKMRNRQGD